MGRSYECELAHDVDDYYSDEETSEERADRLAHYDEFMEDFGEE